MHTLYVHNLNDKIRPSRLQENLYLLFSSYGRVLKVNVSPKQRGQAFVTLAEKVQLEAVQNKLFFGKPMHVEHANTT